MRQMPERISPQLVKVLEVLLSDPQRAWYGFELMRRTQLTSGTLYPILRRLAGDGWLERSGSQPSARGGPGRHLYVLTPSGAAAAEAVVRRRRQARRRAR
jgi:DNA-binding PadR family transcriptional regulator